MFRFPMLKFWSSIGWNWNWINLRLLKKMLYKELENNVFVLKKKRFSIVKEVTLIKSLTEQCRRNSKTKCDIVYIAFMNFGKVRRLEGYNIICIKAASNKKWKKSRCPCFPKHKLMLKANGEREQKQWRHNVFHC